jgi:hypothetical protein
MTKGSFLFRRLKSFDEKGYFIVARPPAAIVLLSIGSSARADTVQRPERILSKYDCCVSYTIEGSSTDQYFAQGFVHAVRFGIAVASGHRSPNLRWTVRSSSLSTPTAAVSPAVWKRNVSSLPPAPVAPYKPGPGPPYTYLRDHLLVGRYSRGRRYIRRVELNNTGSTGPEPCSQRRICALRGK